MTKINTTRGIQQSEQRKIKNFHCRQFSVAEDIACLTFVVKQESSEPIDELIFEQELEITIRKQHWMDIYKHMLDQGLKSVLVLCFLWQRQLKFT